MASWWWSLFICSIYSVLVHKPAFANFPCISRKSSLSEAVDGAVASVGCEELSNSTLVSCGFSPSDDDDSRTGGSYVDEQVTTCFARNAPGGSGVYAHARCCEFESDDIDCKGLNASDWTSGEDATKSLHCATASYQYLMGCSAFSHPDHWSMDGAYPGTQNLHDNNPLSGADYELNGYCTAVNGDADLGIKPNLACCDSPTFALTCVIRYGIRSTQSSSRDVSAVDCGDGYTMTSCSGYGAYRTVNAWYISNEICFAKSHDTAQVVHAAAICCRMDTSAPTAETSPPTAVPSSIPTHLYSRDIDETTDNTFVISIVLLVVLIVCVLGMICDMKRRHLACFKRSWRLEQPDKDRAASRSEAPEGNEDSVVGGEVDVTRTSYIYQGQMEPGMKGKKQMGKAMPAFTPHMTLKEAFALAVNGTVDHRDQVGRFVLATVSEKQGTNLKIHYDGWSRKWDTWSDFNVELYRYAAAGSISKRESHRFHHLKKGDYVDLNPLQRHPGWKCGEIRRLDQKGQVQMVYESQDKNYLYWAHLDNEQEIADFTSKTGTVHQTQVDMLPPLSTSGSPSGSRSKQQQEVEFRDLNTRYTAGGYRIQQSIHVLRPPQGGLPVPSKEYTYGDTYATLSLPAKGQLVPIEEGVQRAKFLTEEEKQVRHEKISRMLQQGAMALPHSQSKLMTNPGQPRPLQSNMPSISQMDSTPVPSKEYTYGGKAPRGGDTYTTLSVKDQLSIRSDKSSPPLPTHGVKFPSQRVLPPATAESKIDDELDRITKSNKVVEFHNFDKEIELIKIIGEGSFGKVYKARWDAAFVAVKIFNLSNTSNGINSQMLAVTTHDDEQYKELVSEIQVTADTPSHPNIVRIAGFCRKPLCVVMEYMAGGSVQKLVYGLTHKPIPSIAEKFVILIKSCYGLAQLTRYNLHHRDVAARNILMGDYQDKISASTDVKITDFGMTRKDNQDGQDQKTKQDGGPLKWMAPESIQQQIYNEKTDVYMFAITIWEIMFGKEPYDNMDALNTAMAVCMKDERPEFLWDLPAGMKTLMKKCWAKDPEQRPEFKLIAKRLERIQKNLNKSMSGKKDTDDHVDQEFARDRQASEAKYGYLQDYSTTTTAKTEQEMDETEFYALFVYGDVRSSHKGNSERRSKQKEQIEMEEVITPAWRMVGDMAIVQEDPETDMITTARMSEEEMNDEVIGVNNANLIERDDITQQEEIAHGQFGAVYTAMFQSNLVVIKEFTSASANGNDDDIEQDMALDEEVVAKKKKEQVARQKEMKAEIVLASSLPEHKNLVQIYGYLKHPFGVVMNFMRGGSVEKFVYRKHMKSKEIPSVLELLIILKKAASGLKFLHQCSLVHRDIACRNILLGDLSDNHVQDSTEVRISDFGMMRKIENVDSKKTVSNFGPLKWMAPETIRWKVYSKKTDVYMFGVTMWEVFYGMDPYPNKHNHVNVAMDVVNKQLRPEEPAESQSKFHDMPDGYQQLMEACWSHDPKQRPDFSKIVDTLTHVQS